MAQIEKKVIVENHEKRENVRLDEYRPISVKDLKAGICYKATMLNYSKNGIYFLKLYAPWQALAPII